MNPNILICHNWAFRLLGNGILESAPVKITTMKVEIDNSAWEIRGGNSIDFTGADMSEIQSQLQRMNAIFYDNKARVPSSSPLIPQ